MKASLAFAIKRLRNGSLLRVTGIFSALCVAVLLFSSSNPEPAHSAGFFDKVFGHTIPGNTGQYRRRGKAQPKRSARKPLKIGKISPARIKAAKKKKKVVKARSKKPRVAVGSGKTYRTMCVRKCDGYFFPVSFSTREKHLLTDAQICQDSCGVPASLYIHPNPGGGIKDLVSYETGKSYTKLKNAFLFKKEFVADCRCKPEPWTREARQQHKEYAEANIKPTQRVALRKQKYKKTYGKIRRRLAQRSRRSRDVAAKYVRTRAKVRGSRFYRRQSAKRRYYLRHARR